MEEQWPKCKSDPGGPGVLGECMRDTTTKFLSVVILIPQPREKNLSTGCQLNFQAIVRPFVSLRVTGGDDGGSAKIRSVPGRLKYRAWLFNFVWAHSFD